MALRTVAINFTSNVSSLTSAFRALESSSTSLFQSAGKIALLFGGALTVGILATVHAAGQFQSAMQQAAAVSDYTATHIDQISKEVLLMSQRMPIAATDLANALTVAERAGFQGAQALQLVGQAAKGAVVGQTDAADATRVLATVLNAYGQSANQAVNTQNILTVAFKNGVGSYQALADAIKSAAPIAAQAHIGLSEVAAAITTMSHNSLDAGTAGQSLNRILLQMVTPTQALSKEVKNLTDAQHSNGFETAGQAIQTLGLSGVLQQLDAKIQGNIDKFVILEPSIRAARGAVTLFANGGKEFNDVLAQMNDQTQLNIDAAKAYEQAQNSFSNQMKQTQNDVKAAEISLGQAFLPTIQNVLKAVAAMGNAFTNLPSGAQSGIAVFAAVAAGALLLGGAMSVLAPLFPAIGAGFEFLATGAINAAAAMGADAVAAGILELAFSPLTLAVVGVAAVLGGIFGLSLISSAERSQKTKEAVDALTQAMLQEQQGAEGATAAQVANDLVHNKMLGTLEAAGVSVTQFTTYLASGGQELGTQTQLLNHFIDGLGLTSAAFDNLSSKDRSKIYNDLTQALSGNHDAFNRLKNDYAEAAQEAGIGADAHNGMIHAISNVVNEVSYFSEANRNEKQQLDATTKSIEDNQAHLLQFGDYLPGISSDIVKLSNDIGSLGYSTIGLQKALNGFVGAEAEFTAAQDGVKTKMGEFTSLQGIYSDTLTANQKALDASTTAGTKAYKANLQDQTQAAQDAARQTVRDNADMLAQIRQQNEAANNSVSAPIAGFQVGRSADEAQLTAQNAKTAAEAHKQQVDQLKQQMTDENQAAQDNARSIARANQDAASSYVASRETATVSLDQFVQKTQEAATKTQQWNDNLAKIATIGGEHFADQLRQMGKDGVDLVNQLATNIGQQSIPKLKAAFDQLDNTASVSFNAFWEGLKKQNIAAQQWKDNLAYLTSAGDPHQFDALVGKFVELGPKAAETLSDTITQIKTGHIQDVIEANNEAQDAVNMATDQAISTYDAQLQLLSKIGSARGSDAAKAIQQAMTQGLSPDAINTIMSTLANQLNLPIDLPVDVKPYLDQAAAQLAGISNAAGIPGLGVGPTPGFAPAVRPGGSTGGHNSVPDPNPSGSNTGSHPRRIVQAEGGVEDHVAMVSSPNTMRIWSEPETGGEAYIPLSPMKRGRSERILEEVAQRFGYKLAKFADGGAHYSYNISDFTAVGKQIQDAIPKWLAAAQFNEWQFSSLNDAGSPFNIPTGAVSGNLIQWLTEAIRLTNVPDNWLQPLEVIAMHESGGDPHSINNWDINAQNGDPSRGLMQTIGSTFRAHAISGHTDIWNPIDNAAAAIEYIIGRYGNVWNVPGIKAIGQGRPYQGYSEGGVVNFGVYDQGGTLPPGVTIAYNGTGRNEQVVTGTATVDSNTIKMAVSQAVQEAVTELRERDRNAAPTIINHPTPVNPQHLAREMSWSRR